MGLTSGLIVLSRNYRALVNVYYGLFAVSLTFFTVFNYLSLQTQDRLWYIRLVVFFSILASTFLLYMLYYLRYKRIREKGIAIAGMVWAFLIAVFSLSPFVFSGLTPSPDSLPIAEPGIYFFIFHLIVFLFLALLMMVRGYRSRQDFKKEQYRLMIIGLVPIAVLSPLTGVLLPVFYGNSSYVFLSPVYTTFFIGAVGYAILRHKLFDIRPVLARSVAYILSIVTVALIYISITLFVLGRFAFQGIEIPLNQQISYALVAVVLVFAFQPLKIIFDKVSNGLFYRDAYDTQEFLDDLNKVLVSKVDLEPLLESTTEVIGRNLKNSFTSFYIRKTQYIKTRLLGDDLSHYEEADFERISQLVSHVHQSVIAIDDFEEEDELKKLMQDHDIAIIARLVTTLEYDLEGVGFLAFGPKRSGSPYSRQDTKMIEIIANELVIAIQNALRFEEIEEFNATLQQKVDDATKKLRKTNEKLKEMDETKDEFISMASHQLRTPLTSVKGYLSMVLEGDAGDIKPMQEKLLSQAFTSSQRMVYLIADLLNVSRLRTGKFVIEKIRANLADIVQGEVEQLKETAFSRDLKLMYEKPDDFPELMIDETKVRQVIMNFIDNAIYYTPSGGSITVKLDDKEESIECTVTDTGMGVPKQDQQHLFTKFYRAGNARKARPDGTGLGLFMAKKVIVAQEGAVIFRSKEGEGSTFGFTFPKKALMPPEKSKKVDI